MSEPSTSHRPNSGRPIHVCRLLVDGACDGAWNMAVDEVLLSSCAARGEPCLRFYRWAMPTVSLGYFQPLADGDKYVDGRKCPVVRRPTGGGAIVHDAELTYSFCVPRDHALAADPMTLYRAIHGSLIAALADLSVQASLSESDSGLRPEAEPFLCFQRRAKGDVLVEGVKIAGSAQRRPNDAILQHGSVILGASTAAPELPSLEELTGRTIDPTKLIATWTPRFSAALALAFHEEPYANTETHKAKQLVESRYGRAEWNARK